MLYSDLSRLTGSGASSRPRIIIIGSGAVGLYAASGLASRGRNVLVVEAGDSYLGNFSSDSYRSIGRPHGGISLARSRSLGGTTNLWGGQLVEFQPVDFNGRDWLPGSRWPVSYDEIAPYYKKTYQNLGIEPLVQDDDAVWNGISTKRPQVGKDFEVFLTRWMKIPNVAAMFAQQINSDPRLNVLTGQTAVGFRGEPGGRITAVRVLDPHRQAHWLEGDTFILAAGTIENSRLMLHAAQSPEWDCPWRDNANVGRYFLDHLGARIGPFHPVDKRAFFNMFCNIVFAGQKFQPKIRLRSEVQSRQRILNIQGLFGFENKAREHLTYLKQFLSAAISTRKVSGIGDLFRHGMGSIRYLVPLMWRYIKDHRIFVPGSSSIFLHSQAEHVARPESRITIDKSCVDCFGLPCAVLDWRIGDCEQESFRQFALQIRDALEAAGIGRLDIDPELLSNDGRFLEKVGDTYHQAGGTVMGASEQDGVVDGNLRVFGTTNFYVGGASTFRTPGNANTTFTAMTFTTRLVEHLTAEPARGA